MGLLDLTTLIHKKRLETVLFRAFMFGRIKTRLGLCNNFLP